MLLPQVLHAYIKYIYIVSLCCVSAAVEFNLSSLMRLSRSHVDFHNTAISTQTHAATQPRSRTVGHVESACVYEYKWCIVQVEHTYQNQQHTHTGTQHSNTVNRLWGREHLLDGGIPRVQKKLCLFLTIFPTPACACGYSTLCVCIFSHNIGC